MDNDVDNLIERHQQRLQEHRHFLDGDGDRQSPTVDNVRGSSRRISRGVHSGDATPDDDAPIASRTSLSSRFSAPDANSYHHHHRRLPQASGTTEYNSTAGELSAIAGDEEAGGSGRDVDDETSNADGGHTMLLRDGRVSYHQAAAANGVGVGGLDDANHHHNGKLMTMLESTRYFTNSPTRMYDRSSAWAASVEQKRRLLKTNYNSETMEECTFRPMTHTDDYEASYQQQHYRDSEGSWPTLIDVGEANFIERQHLARRRKEEAQQRLFPDTATARSRQRVTVPKEFSLGRRTEVVPSLRKPLQEESSPMRPTLYVETPRSGSAPATTVNNANNNDASRAHLLRAAKNRASSRQQSAPSSHNHDDSNAYYNETVQLRDGDGGRKNSAGEGGGVPRSTAAAKTPAGAVADETVQQTLASQATEIEELKLTLSLAQRELAVARATIRDISLSSH